MKTLIGAVLGISIFAAAALAINLQYQTRFITSATLTINVKAGFYLRIKNFTQDNANSGERGVIMAGIFSTPTPAPTPVPTPTPTLSTQAGPAVALSTGGKLTDRATLSGDTNPTGTITFSLLNPSLVLVDTETVAVNGNGNYNTPSGFSPTVAGTYRWAAFYSGDSHNSAATDNGQNETEIVTATPTPVPTATPTPTPIVAGVLAATILNPVAFVRPQPAPTLDPAKPFIIAGPATLTIDPVPGATLSITYRKMLQPSGTPTPTPTSTVVTPTPTATPTPTVAALSIGSSTTSSQSVVATVSMPSDDEDTFSTPTPTATPTPTPSSHLPTPTPTSTPLITPTPLPTPS